MDRRAHQPAPKKRSLTVSMRQGDLSPRRLAELTEALEAAELEHILVRVPLFGTLREQEVAHIAR